MKEYVRAGRTWKFGPLPATVPTAVFFRCLAKLHDFRLGGGVSLETIADLMECLPKCVERSMRGFHSAAEVGEFLDTLEIDLEDADALVVIADLNLLFMGKSPGEAEEAAAAD